MEHHLLQDFCDGSHKVPLKTDEKEAIKMNNLDRNDKTMFAKTTQDGIASRFLRPLLQCDYDRLSFETPYTNKGLQITLDTNISFSHLQGTMFTENKDNEAYNFPYAVLEVKLDTDTKFDDPSLYWLNAFTQKCKLLHEIPRFSKYIQGIYQVFSAQTSAENDIYTAVQGRLPTWINLYQKRISASANYDSLSRSKSLRPLLNGKSYRGIIPYINRSNDGTKSLSSSSPVSNRYSIIHRYSSSTRHNNSDYTSISMPVDDQITRSAVLVQNENLKFVPDMNEKTEMQFSTTIESSVKSSPVSSSNSDRFLWKHDNNSDCNNKLILDRDGNPIVYKNQPKAFFKSSHRKKGVDVEQYVKESNKKKKNNDDLVKIEPKVFFANERTFISWLQFCALLLTVALNLLNFGDHISRICGALFLSISAVLALYALARFQCRAWQLRTPNYKGRFDDIYGPAVLCVLIVAALIINFWLRFRYMPEIDSNRSYLKVGSNSTTI
jgi:uncharacterized membrane protein YidH (DUF202 family)